MLTYQLWRYPEYLAGARRRGHVRRSNSGGHFVGAPLYFGSACSGGPIAALLGVPQAL
jgi:hypothetical protein